MPSIDEYLKKILSARYGEEVRSSIHDSLKAMNDALDDTGVDELIDARKGIFNLLYNSTLGDQLRDEKKIIENVLVQRTRNRIIIPNFVLGCISNSTEQINLTKRYSYRLSTGSRLFTEKGLVFKYNGDTTYSYAIRMYDSEDSSVRLYDSGFKQEDFKVPEGYYGKYFAIQIRRGGRSDSEDTENLITTVEEFIKMANIIYLEFKEDEIEEPSTYIQQNISSNFASVAHQGLTDGSSGNYGRSLVYSYLNASKNGFNCGECDICFTSDGIPVCSHDETFSDQSTKEDVSISSITLKELKTHNYYGHTISTFEEVVKICKEVGISKLFIDKLSGSYTDEKWKSLFEIVDKYSYAKNCYFVVMYTSSKKSEMISKIIEWNPDANIAILGSDFNQEEYISFISHERNEESNNRSHICPMLNHTYNSVEDVMTINQKLGPNNLTFVYTIDDEETYKSYMPYANGIISNKISALDIGKKL